MEKGVYTFSFSGEGLSSSRGRDLVQKRKGEVISLFSAPERL